VIEKILAIVVSTTALTLCLAMPAQASESRGACSEESRDINASGAEEVQTVYADGTRGRAQITLRRLESANCFWGLLEGPGVIWLERISWYNDGYRNPDFSLYQRTNKENDRTHTAATVTTAHSVRACGRGYDGTRSEGISFGAGAGVSGKAASADVSFGGDWTDTYEFADGTVCTDWVHADTIMPNY